jgi:hypothetical protein
MESSTSDCPVTKKQAIIIVVTGVYCAQRRY